MNPVRHLLSDLDDTIRPGSPERHETTLWQVTDLFLGDVERLTEEQIDIFDTVIARLAPRDRDPGPGRARPPPRAGRQGAARRDPLPRARRDRGRPAGPGPFAAPSRTRTSSRSRPARSGDHREAIARRPQLSRPVSDVLVARGDEPVMRALAANPGARLSQASVAVLVDRARLDEELQVLLRARTDLPQDQVRRLFEAAEDGRPPAAHRLDAARPARDRREGAHRARPSRSARSAGSLDYGQALDTIGSDRGQPADRRGGRRGLRREASASRRRSAPSRPARAEPDGGRAAVHGRPIRTSS